MALGHLSRRVSRRDCPALRGHPPRNEVRTCSRTRTGRPRLRDRANAFSRREFEAPTRSRTSAALHACRPAAIDVAGLPMWLAAGEFRSRWRNEAWWSRDARGRAAAESRHVGIHLLRLLRDHERSRAQAGEIVRPGRSQRNAHRRRRKHEHDCKASASTGSAFTRVKSDQIASDNLSVSHPYTRDRQKRLQGLTGACRAEK